MFFPNDIRLFVVEERCSVRTLKDDYCRSKCAGRRKFEVKPEEDYSGNDVDTRTDLGSIMGECSGPAHGGDQFSPRLGAEGWSSAQLLWVI